MDSRNRKPADICRIEKGGAQKEVDNDPQEMLQERDERYSYKISDCAVVA